MTQKNKIFSITLSLLILGSVACRKSGGGGDPTPIDPTKSMTGNLLIVSADGKTNLNSIPLRFAGANATVTKVEVEKGKTLKLDTTNFIVENNALKLTKFDLSTEDAAVSNKVILTFDLSASSSSPITRYTDTAEIYVGKYSNISTNILDTFKKLTKMDTDALSDTTDTSHPIKNLEFDFTKMTNATTNSSFLLLENTRDGDANMLVNGARFVTNLNKSITAQKTLFDTYFTDVKVNGFNTNDSESIANFQIDFSGKKSYLYYYEGEPNYHLIFFLKQGKWDNNLGQ